MVYTLSRLFVSFGCGELVLQPSHCCTLCVGENLLCGFFLKKKCWALFAQKWVFQINYNICFNTKFEIKVFLYFCTTPNQALKSKECFVQPEPNRTLGKQASGPRKLANFSTFIILQVPISFSGCIARGWGGYRLWGLLSGLRCCLRSLLFCMGFIQHSNNILQIV